jgi:hypothetical protein
MKKTTFSIAGIFTLLIFLLSSCEKEGTPSIDAINPVMQLTLNGGGFNKTFSSEEDYSLGQLNLKSSTKYNFTLSISDTGGVKRLQLRLPREFTLSGLSSTPMAVDTLAGLKQYVTINVPQTATTFYKSFLITGSFTTPDAANTDWGLDIYAEGSDYRPNRVSLGISCLVTNNPPMGYGWITF